MKRAFLWLVCLLIAETPLHAFAGDESLFVQDTDRRYVVFGGIDSGRSNFASIGAKWSLASASLDRSGPLQMVTLGLGGSVERTDLGNGQTATARISEGANLFGYQWGLGNTFIAAFLGPDYIQRQRFADGETIRRSEPRLGGRFQWELFSRPTTDTMVVTSFIASSSSGSVWSRTSFGYRTVKDIFIGPEASVYVKDGYRETRLGAHVTGLKIGRLDMRLSGGWWGADDRHNGFYTGLSAYMKM